MPILHMLVGLPATGKSTWGRSKFPGAVYVSTDEYIDQRVQELGRSYTEIFHEEIDMAISKMLEKVTAARDAGLDIVWDQTSLTPENRARKLLMLPGYEAKAYYFTVPDPAEHRRRLDSRPGKVIDEDTLLGMAASEVAPTYAEGFSQIFNIKAKS